MPVGKSAPKEFWVVVGLMLMLALPAWLTLRTVQTGRALVPVEENPTPLGYTWSLLLFIVPALAIGWKVMTLRGSAAEKKAFWLTVALLFPAGCGLDVFFGMTFFTFENKAATLRWDLPGYVWGRGFEGAIPIEEFAFYAFGFLCILLTYVWADRVWMVAYSPEEQSPPGEPSARSPRWQRTVQTTRRLTERGSEVFLSSSLSPVVCGALLFGLAWLAKRHGPEAYRAGLPGYFLFLLAASIVPSAVCFRIAARLINWRAFAFSFSFIFLVSLFWEATLGVPYQWWGYRPEQMMGISLRAFCNLPLEAVLVWVFANWTTVLVYEAFLLAFRTGTQPVWRVFCLTREELRRLTR